MYPKRAVDTSGVVSDASITVSTTAIAITTAYDPQYVGQVTFDVQGYDVRARWTGTDPTSTVGHILPASTAYTWDVAQFNAAKFIRDVSAAGDATIFHSPMGN